MSILSASPHLPQEALRAGVPTTYTVTSETMDQYVSSWRHYRHIAAGSCLFVSAPWVRAWHRHFGHGAAQDICSFRSGDDVLGVAPMQRQGETVSFMGSADVCDYVDFIVSPGRARCFVPALIDRFQKNNIVHLDLGPCRCDSVTFTRVLPIARSLGCRVHYEEDDVIYEMGLPAAWDDYLGLLSGKQRHELRRKLRRLQESAEVRYRVIDGIGCVRDGLDTFLRLFKLNRADKSAFMTSRMAAYFRALAESLAESGVLKLIVMDLNGEPAAAVLCFDFQSTRFLYNSAYDARFAPLNVSLLCKAFSIRDAIERGLKKYDFLKGNEIYKHRLGGSPVQLYRCRIDIEPCVSAS